MKKILILAAALLSALPSWSKGKLSPDLSPNGGPAVDVIIQYKVPPQQKHLDNIASRGGQVTDSVELVKGIVAHVPALSLVDLTQDPDVAYVSPDRPLHPFLNNAAPAINAPYAWNLGFDGTGIGVAVIDSGMQTPIDLNDSSGKTRVKYNQSFIVGDKHIIDVYGHGNHIGGLIAGNGGSSNGLYKGIAPDADIINLRVLDANGVGTDSAAINAINAA
ncbi:MAG TPA: S8 family serine peptidase, partial [Candidatus Angelobacter sp.]|nr:S8 family serine peptidase [Candidatus Angelobacter sp.]